MLNAKQLNDWLPTVAKTVAARPIVESAKGSLRSPATVSDFNLTPYR